MPQASMSNSQNTSNNKMSRKQRLLIAMGASAISGLLIAASMPNFNMNFFGWFALVPLLLAIAFLPDESPEFLATPFGLIWSIAVHNWYPAIFGSVWGYILIVLVGSFYAMLIGWGITLQRRMPSVWKLFALPVLWTAVEFIKFIAPIVDQWWFVLLAKSQWQFPPALQILGVTGFPGLTFLLMLSNVALSFLLVKVWQERKIDWPSALALGFVVLVIGWGFATIPNPPADTFVIASTVDMANQDPDIQVHSETYSDVEGPYADTPEMSQAIFDVNAELTRAVAGQSPAFVVWPENEFSDADDAYFIDQVGSLAGEIGAYIVTDVVWRTPTGMHDTALMVGPDENEVGRRAKMHPVGGELDYGFTAGPADFPVFETPYGKVGIGVCYDYHFLDVVRNLARSGADIILMPTDDDFNHNPWFPAFHASDAVFRAVEHRVAFATSGTNGISIIVDPYGRIVAQSGVNKREVVNGGVFTAPGQTLYTRLGDWFGWLMVVCLAAMVGVVFLVRR